MALTIANGRVLLAEGKETQTIVAVADGRIAALGGAAAGGRRIDASGLLVLPGMVDLHGDAFERQMQPRPGVTVPVGLALRDTEAQLLANGITTALHAITLSWEPGLRGAESWRALLDALTVRRPGMACDMRAHLRWELHNLDALPMALADIAAGRVHMLSFNDHTPAIVRKLGNPAAAAKYTERAGIAADAFRLLADRAHARGGEVDAAAAQLAAAARASRLPMASHDDDTVAGRAAYRALGARICEFPVTEAVAVAARAAGDAVVMGSPNVMRGGSHLGWASAAAMVARGLCSVLCSDYYYPAMLQAALALYQAGTLDLAAAWALVAANPAAAAGLHDRGSIAPGRRADLVLVDPQERAVLITIAGGVVAHASACGWARIT